MRVFELDPKIANYASPPGDDMAAFEKTVYARYLEYMARHHQSQRPLTYAQFLLTRVEGSGYDSFLWAKDTLVKVRDSNMIGIVTGWCDVGFTSPTTAVEVRTAKGGGGQHPANLEVAGVPPEVLEYVASTLKGRVHDKVEEAFDADQGP